MIRPILLYNCERLFRPGGSSRPARALGATASEGWDRQAYEAKIGAVAAVALDATAGVPPALWFLVEVESARVVADLCDAAGWPQLVDVTVPGEAVDGYDVAIAYDPSVFEGGVRKSSSHIFDNRFSTRDLLVATLSVAGGRDLVAAASHWASRKLPEGEPLRHAAAYYCSQVLERIVKYGREDLVDSDGRPRLRERTTLETRWNTPIVIGADLNDGPWDRTVRNLLRSTPDEGLVRRPPRLPEGDTVRDVAFYLSRRARLWNPTWALATGPGPRGTYRFDGEFTPLDQFLCSAGLLDDRPPSFMPGSVRVHAPVTVASPDGAEIVVATPSGVPRGFSNKTHEGASDHFPLVAELELPDV